MSLPISAYPACPSSRRDGLLSLSVNVTLIIFLDYLSCLIVNKIDIADAVGVDPNVLINDYKKLTGGRKVMIEASARKEIGLETIIEELGL